MTNAILFRDNKMENQRKAESLDNGLLFALGLVTFVITLLQINMDDPTQVIEAIPFIVLGIVLPFVVGYLRGAIEFDSVEERLRGWIYFLIGTFSYFAFFATFRIRNYGYAVTESVFIFILICGTVTTYLLLKWAKRIFNIQNLSVQYAYSATILGAATCAWLLRTLISIFLDFQGRNVYELITTDYASLPFWISISLFSFSIVVVCEKASGNALKRKLQLPNLGNRIQRSFIIRGLSLGIRLFEYSLGYNFKALLLWIYSFCFWFLGCLLLALKANPLSLLFFVIMIIPWLMATILFYRTQMSDFKGVDKTYPHKAGFLLVIAMCTVLMVLGGNIVSLLEAIGLSIIQYLLRFVPIKKRK
jgi:hypothetical protein